MTREEAIEEVNKAFEPAFANYIITALTEGTTVSDKEPTTKNNIRDNRVKNELNRVKDELEPTTKNDLGGAICNGVVLPDNATNGDVMKAMFKEIVYYSDGQLCSDWWNAPYQGGQEKWDVKQNI